MPEDNRNSIRRPLGVIKRLGTLSPLLLSSPSDPQNSPRGEGRHSLISTHPRMASLSPPQKQPRNLLETGLSKMMHVWPTGATQDEYSGEVGRPNDSKMEPQMNPHRQRPTLTKHAQAWSNQTSTLLSGPPFSFCPFDPYKNSQLSTSKGPLRKFGAEMNPTVAERNPQR